VEDSNNTTIQTHVIRMADCRFTLFAVLSPLDVAPAEYDWTTAPGCYRFVIGMSPFQAALRTSEFEPPLLLLAPASLAVLPYWYASMSLTPSW
jgi:hypothetical protein